MYVNIDTRSEEKVGERWIANNKITERGTMDECPICSISNLAIAIKQYRKRVKRDGKEEKRWGNRKICIK